MLTNNLTNNIVESPQRLRMRRFGMSVATYAVAILVTFLITRIGIGELSVAQWATLIGICLLGISLFFILFYTNTNVRFSEPSLTREQIVYSSLYGIVAMYWLPEARPIILLFLLPPFSFGMLSLTLRQYLIVVACVMGLYAGLLIFEYLQGRPGFEIQYQLFLFCLFGILLTWFAVFGGFVSNIRRRLRIQREESKNAHEELITEMEERKRLEEQLLEFATIDELTKVWNRRFFLEQAGRQVKVQARSHGPLAVLMVDIDHFKQVNDRFGHHIGDDALRTVSKSCLASLRETDLFGRLGGEEFAALLIDCDQTEAMQTAERLRKAVSKTDVLTPKDHLHLTISVGVSSSNLTLDLEKLIKEADLALYKAKETGRDRVCSFI